MGNNASVQHPTQLSLTLIDTKQDAQRKLEMAERIDSYFYICQSDPMNALARRNLTYAVNSISPKEAAHYQTLLNHMIKELPIRLRMDLEDISIIPLMPSSDGGMPHTRPQSLICYPQIGQLTSLSTMIHELWHVHQRKYKDTWKLIFEKLGWSEWDGALPAFLEKNRRVNPDTVDAPLWVYQNTWVPIPVFQDISLPDVTEVNIWFYHIKEHYHLKQIPIKLGNYFPNLPQSAYEHPRELTAYLLASPEKHRDSPALQDLLSLVGILAISSK
jgi:hypothetical protein